MSVLIACEESQAVCIAMRQRGIEAYSCDILPPSGGHPEWHLQSPLKDVISRDWVAVIAFPPCTHLCRSGARWWPEKQADGRQQAAIDFFMMIANSPVQYIAIENPIGHMSAVWRKPDQIIQPWQHGHGETKATCLWLKGLPALKPSNIVSGRIPKTWLVPGGPKQSMLRSKTLPGIAAAMADQWGPVIDNTMGPYELKG